MVCKPISTKMSPKQKKALKSSTLWTNEALDCLKCKYLATFAF